MTYVFDTARPLTGRDASRAEVTATGGDTPRTLADWMSITGRTYFSLDVAAASDLTDFDFVVIERWSNTSGLCPASYVRVGSEPAHDLKFQDSTGAWFENQEAVINVVMAGADPSGAVVNATAAIRRALTPNRPVEVPVGSFDVDDSITLNDGQKVYGAGRVRSFLNVVGTFNLTADGVFIFPSGDSECVVEDLGFVFNQPTPFVGMARSDLIHYPPAIYAEDSARWSIDRLRVTNGWDGIGMLGNAGGVTIGHLELGCFNVGIDMDGALDFVAIDKLHFWGFGIGASGTPDGDLFRDGTTISLRAGRVDGLHIGALTTLRGNVVFTANAASGLPIVIDYMALDSNPKLSVAGGEVLVGGMYSSSASGALLSAIEVTGGTLEIVNPSVTYSGSHEAIIQTGGRLRLRGGRIIHYSDSYPAVDSTGGGRLTIDGTELTPAADRTTPYIEAGAFSQITGTVASDAPSGVYKKIIQIATDGANVNIANNQLNGWELDIPTGANLGIYGPNGESELWTPTLVFATMGDAVFSYPGTRSGRLYRDSTGYFFEARVEFSTNAFTTASGAFAVIGLPALGVGISGVPVDVGGESLIDLPAGYTQLGATYSTSTSIDARGHIAFNAVGDNASLVAITTTHVKASVSNFALFISGYVATR